jgi:hypothetical protein
MVFRAVTFIAGFACGALIFIALQGFGQTPSAECTGPRCDLLELPALGEAPAQPAQAERKTEKKKSLLVPVGATIGMIAVMSLWGKDSNMPCASYPCAHYAHVGTGVGIGYLFTSYYSPGSAFTAGLTVAVGKELLDKHDGKSFSRTDVATRLLGTGLGIYIARTF